MGSNLDPGTDTSGMVFLLVGKGKPGPGVDRMWPPGPRLRWGSRQARPPGPAAWSRRARPAGSVVSTGSTTRLPVVSTSSTTRVPVVSTSSTTRGRARPPGPPWSRRARPPEDRLDHPGPRGLDKLDHPRTGSTTRTTPWSRRARPPETSSTGRVPCPDCGGPDWQARVVVLSLPCERRGPGGNGEPYLEAGAPGRRLDRDPATVCRSDRVDQRQTQARTSGLAGTRGITTAEPL